MRPSPPGVCVFVAAAIGLAGCGGGGGGGSTTVATHTVVAWNDLGMHCMDSDFSVFAILPPYNNLHAQVVERVTSSLATSGLSLTYQATPDTRGSTTSGAASRTNFWLYVNALLGASPAPDQGLAGNPTPSSVPALLEWFGGGGYYRAEGIPIVDTDDGGATNPYPMVKVVARDASGWQVGETSVVLPVSTEMSCASCHASTSGAAARPTAGWVTEPNLDRQWRLNILRLHDEKAPRPLYTDALASIGRPEGLEAAAALNGNPVLCASCHASNALGTAGYPGVKPLTAAVHSHHASVLDGSGATLDASTNRTACYVCHPGSVTQCLRGAMSRLLDVQCQSCHGTMSAVGDPARDGWLDEPSCAQCHYRPSSTVDYARATTVFSSPGVPRASAGLFATPGSPPALYKVAAGHGGMRCEACHGPTHAEYPCSEPNDNVQSVRLQGHAGTLAECTTCHATPPDTADGGPHGLHTVGQAWVGSHGDHAEGGAAACATCHGQAYRGTFLSKTSAARSFSVEGGTRAFPAGHQVGCYDCHDGPSGG